MKKVKSLSVFFPVHNEAGNINRVIESTLAILPKLTKKWEIIVVNDGSTDKTGQVVEKLIEKEPRIRMITHNRNYGYGSALKDGFYNASYEWIVFTDGDGQFDFGEVTKFLEKADQADLVIGYRIDRQDPFIRKLFGWGWTFLANLLLGIKVKDVDCGFKLVKKEVIDAIPRLASIRGGMISPELLAKTKKAGFKITQVGVHHFPRQEGKQTGAELKVIFESFLDLAKLWWQLR